MTSGVYPRAPGAKTGRKPLLTLEQVTAMKAMKVKGIKTKFIAAAHQCCVETVQRALAGRDAYKELK